MNPCSTNGTKGCLENPQVYALDMEAVAAIGQQPARITNLEAVQANSTIHEAAASFLWFLIIKARKVLQITNIVTTRHSLRGAATLALLSSTTSIFTMTMIIVIPSESPPHDAEMDGHQNSNPNKQDDQRNHNLHHHNLAEFNFCEYSFTTKPLLPSSYYKCLLILIKFCLLLKDNKIQAQHIDCFVATASYLAALIITYLFIYFIIIYLSIRKINIPGKLKVQSAFMIESLHQESSILGHIETKFSWCWSQLKSKTKLHNNIVINNDKYWNYSLIAILHVFVVERGWHGRVMLCTEQCLGHGLTGLVLLLSLSVSLNSISLRP